MLQLLGSEYCGIDVRQHSGSRAYHRAGSCSDALALQGQLPSMLVLGLRFVLACLALAEALAFAIHLKDVHVVGQSNQEGIVQAF
jgi:hypothetical protein